MKPKHLLLGGLAVAGGILLWKFVKAGKNLVVQTASRIHKLTLTSLELALDPVVQNPTGGAIRIKFPYVQIKSGDSLLATTEPVNVDVRIPPYSQVNLRSILKRETGKDFNIAIPVTNILWLAPKIVQLFMGTLPSLDLTVVTQTTAFAPGLPIGGISVKEEKLTSLKKPTI